MTTFNWLHFSDLHWSSFEHRWKWGKIFNALKDDIQKVKGKAKIEKWDAVFFTGDLVNKGNEYTELNEKLLLIYYFGSGL